ncbi:hypothetical protein D9M70_609840 [compost metagenome]
MCGPLRLAVGRGPIDIESQNFELTGTEAQRDIELCLGAFEFPSVTHSYGVNGMRLGVAWVLLDGAFGSVG